MTIYLLDTNIISDLVRFPQGPRRQGHCKCRYGHHFDQHRGCLRIALRRGQKSSPVLTERIENVLARIKVWPLEQPADAIYGELRASLERQGSLIGANDMLIAAQCLALDAILVTDNEREFARVPRLRIENWLR